MLYQECVTCAHMVDFCRPGQIISCNNNHLKAKGWYERDQWLCNPCTLVTVAKLQLLQQWIVSHYNPHATIVISTIFLVMSASHAIVQLIMYIFIKIPCIGYS